MRLVDMWAEYVKTHDDKDWSHQQNIIINSALKSASMTKEQFFKMKGEKHFQWVNEGALLLEEGPDYAIVFVYHDFSWLF